MTVNPDALVLEMRKITKSFPGVKALDGRSLQVRAGSVPLPKRIAFESITKENVGNYSK